MFTPHDFSMPTIAEMNNANDVVKVQLLMLRTICTSDMAFMYHLYQKDTVKDIVRQAKHWIDPKWDPSMFVTEEAFNEDHIPFDRDSTMLSDLEMVEYKELIEQLEEYVNHQP